jgi:hypothetical protein
VGRTPPSSRPCTCQYICAHFQLTPHWQVLEAGRRASRAGIRADGCSRVTTTGVHKGRLTCNRDNKKRDYAATLFLVDIYLRDSSSKASHGDL